MSILNEDLMKTNLDIPDGEIKIDGKVNPVYADAINVHNKKKKDIEKILKDKQPELKKPFLGTKGNTTIMPKTKDLKKLKLAEDMFKPMRESMADAPEAYEGIFRVIDNMEHIINYISELSDEELNYEDMKQSYDVLDDAMTEFSGYLDELKSAESRNGSLKEATAVKSKKETKDIWDDIYAELVGVKSVEASRRRLDRTPSERYPADWRENGPRVGMSRTEDALVVKADDMSDLDFGKEVAETYGVEWRVKEHTSMYADSKYELLIYPFKPVLNESLVESVDNEVYSAVAKYYDYGAPSDFIEVIADLVDRALMNKDEDYDTEEAVSDAIDSGLIYHKDIWTVKSNYEDSILSDETYERLFSDIYSIVDSLASDEIEEGLNEQIEHRFIQPLKDIVYFCYSKEDLEQQGADLSQLSDKDIERILGGKVTNGDIEKMFGLYHFVDDDFGIVDKRKVPHRKSNTQRYNDRMDKISNNSKNSLKESYVEVDTIECGEDVYKVVYGGVDFSKEKLVPVEDKDGNKTKLYFSDMIEFYTWYDKKGNVIHEPSEDSLDEAVCNYVDTYNGATIYECDGKYSADVSVWHGDKSNSKRVVADSVDELKRKIDNASKEYVKQAEYTNESKSRRIR